MHDVSRDASGGRVTRRAGAGSLPRAGGTAGPRGRAVGGHPCATDWSRLCSAVLLEAREMRLNVEPSESFDEQRSIDVEAEDIKGLVAGVGAALGSTVTEIFVWDEDFEEFALLEDISELHELLEEADSAKVQVTVTAGKAPAALARKPSAPPRAAPSKVNKAELEDILAASDSDLSDEDEIPTLAEAMQKPVAASPRPPPPSPRKPAPKPAPKVAATPEPSQPPSPPLEQPPAGAAPKPAAKPSTKPTRPPNKPQVKRPTRPTPIIPAPTPAPAPTTARAPAPSLVRPVLASASVPRVVASAAVTKTVRKEDEHSRGEFDLVNPDALKAVLDASTSGDAVEVIDAPAIVDKERLHRKTSAAGSQVVLVEPKSAIGQHLTTPTTRRDAGIPTCMEVRSRWIAIGMSHGTVLVFNHFGGLEQTVDLGITQPVTSTDVSIPSEEFLVVGYGDGTFVLWDLDADKIKLKIDGSKRGSPHSSPVIVSHFLPGTPTVITIDTTGKVNKTLFINQRIRWSNKTEELFDGSAGRFTAAKVLPPSTAREPTNHKFLTALSSKDAVYVMTLEPVVKQCFKQSRPPGVREGSLPFLSWRPDLRRGANAFKQNGDPMLVIAWGKEILLLQAMLSWLMMEDNPDEADIQLIPKGSYTNDCEIQLVTWLNPQVFVFIDDQWTMRVFDPSRLQVMESTEMRSLGLVSHNYFKSEDGDEEDESSFHHSITLCDEKIYLLGREHVSTCRVYKWTERLDLLVEQNKWEDALSLGLDFYEGKAKAAEGLPSDFEGLHRVVGDHMSEIVEDFLDTMFRTAPEDPTEAAAHYRKACGVCIDYSIVIGREEMLFDEVWSKFTEAGHQSVFLELLEPFILADHLRQLAPEVLQAFVEHYQAQGALSRVEQCLTHMDIAVIDFNQVARLCREHELYSGLIYIYNAGCDDFVAPAEELLKAITEHGSTPKVNLLCTRLLRYVHDCLTRNGECKRVAVYDYSTSMNRLRTYLFTQPEGGDDPPVLRLLQLNTAGTLAVLAPIFDGRCCKLEDNYAEEVQRYREHAKMDAMDQGLDPPVFKEVVSVSAQDCFERLAGLTIDTAIPPLDGQGDFDGQLQLGRFNVDDLHALYVALLKWGCHRAPDAVPPQIPSVLISCDLGYRLMMYLICAPEQAELSTARRALLLDELLRCKKTSPFDNAIVLEQLERLDAAGAQIQLGLARAYLYELLHRYDKLIESMLKNTDDTAQVFEYLGKLLETDGSDDEHGDKRKEGVRKAFMGHMREFVTLDSKAAAALIVKHFGDHCVDLVKQLSDDRATQFSFMDALITADIEAESDGKSGASGGLPSDLHELYLSLLCEFVPEKVKAYLERTASYRLDDCLELCQTHNIVDATAYLLERMGNPLGAMELMLSLLPAKLQIFLDAANNARRLAADPLRTRSTVEVQVQQQLRQAATPLQSLLNDAVKLCRKNTSVWQSEAENEDLWFSLLDAFGEQQKTMETNLPRASSAASEGHVRTQSTTAGDLDVVSIAHTEFLRLLQQILESMAQAGAVSLRKVLNKIFDDYAYMKLDDMIGIITGLLEQYTQEAEVLEISRNLQNNPSDSLALYRKLIGGICVPSGAAPSTVRPKCCIAGTPLHGTSASNAEQRKLEGNGCVVAASGAASHMTYQCLLSTGIRKRRVASMATGMHPRPFPGRSSGAVRVDPASLSPGPSKLTAAKTRLNGGILTEAACTALLQKGHNVDRGEQQKVGKRGLEQGTDLLEMLRDLKERQEQGDISQPRRVPVSTRPPNSLNPRPNTQLERPDKDGLLSVPHKTAFFDLEGSIEDLWA